MNTVKRWLAGFLSFAMIFTSAAFTNLGAVTGFAATTFDLAVTCDNGSVNKTSQTGTGAHWGFTFATSAQYGDDITLHAASTISDESVGNSGVVVYQWLYTDQDGNPQGALGDTLTFSPKYNELEDLTVGLKVTQYYTANGVANVKTADAVITVDVLKKSIDAKNIADPEFYTVYLNNGQSSTTIGDLAGQEGDNPELLAKLLKNEASDPVYGGTWVVDTSVTPTTTVVGANKTVTVGLKYTLNNNLYTAGAGNWNGNSLTTTAELSVKPYEVHVSSITPGAFVNDGQTVNSYLYYNASLVGNKNYTLDEGTWTITSYNTSDNSTSGALVEVSTSDENVKATWVPGAGLAGTVKVAIVGEPASDLVDVTIADSKGSCSNTITIPIHRAILQEEIAFEEVEGTYGYKDGLTQDEIFDVTEANKKYEDTGVIYNKGSWTGLGTNDAIIIGSVWTFTGSYTRAEKEAFIEPDKDPGKSGWKLMTSTSENVTTINKILTNTYKVTVTENVLTKEYIQEAVDNIKVDGTVLSGGEIPYGVTLTGEDSTVDTWLYSDGYPGVKFKLFRDLTATTPTQAYGNGKANNPDLGTYNRVYGFTAEAETNYSLPTDNLKFYPVSFTVVPATLSARVDYNVVAYSEEMTNYSWTEVQNGAAQPETAVTALRAVVEGAGKANNKAIEGYTYEYTWYAKQGDTFVKVSNSSEVTDASGVTGQVWNPSKGIPANEYYVTVKATKKATTAKNYFENTDADSDEVRVLNPTSIKASGYEKENDLTKPVPALDGIVVLPGSFAIQVTATDNPVSTSSYKINEIEVSIRKDGKVIGEPQVFDGDSKSYKWITYTAPLDLDATYDPSKGNQGNYFAKGNSENVTWDNNPYQIWVTTSTETTTAAGVTTTDYFEKKVSDYHVAKFNMGLARFVANHNNASWAEKYIVDSEGLTELTYGEKPSDKLNYVVAFNGEALKTDDDNGKYELNEEQVAKVNQLFNDNFTFTVKEGYDTVDNAGMKNIEVKAEKAKAFDDTNICNYDKNALKAVAPGIVDTYKVAQIKINKAELALVPSKEAYVWSLGATDNEEIEASYEGFVNGDTAEALGLGYDYDVIDKDGKVVKISTIGAGTYTVQLKATEETKNYNIVPGTATLTVKSSAQNEAESFVAAVKAADLTKEEDVKALEEAYAALGKDAKALVPEEELKKVTDARTNLDAVAAAKAAVEKATAANATDADIKAAQDALAKLTDAQKAIYGKDALDKATADVKKAADNKESANNQAAADKVIGMLSKITDSSSPADAKAAVDAYNALTAAQKALVDANPTAKANLAKAQAKVNEANKKAPTVKFKTKSPKKFKAKDLKKKAKTFKIKASADSKGKITYKKMKGTSKKLKLSKSGKVTVKKGTKKGTYKLKVKATAAAKGNFKSGSKTKTYKVVVK